MSDDSWQDFQEYQLLIRVLYEQSKVDENNNTVPKDKSDITSTSLQNPSDPDATYRSKAGKSNKGYAVHVSASMVQRAKYLAKLSTEEYRLLTRQRNAVEGIPSVLRRKYHIDDIPVLGYLRSRQFFWLKIGTYNFKKLIKHNRRKQVECAQNLAIV